MLSKCTPLDVVKPNLPKQTEKKKKNSEAAPSPSPLFPSPSRLNYRLSTPPPETCDKSRAAEQSLRASPPTLPPSIANRATIQIPGRRRGGRGPALTRSTNNKPAFLRSLPVLSFPSNFSLPSSASIHLPTQMPRGLTSPLPEKCLVSDCKRSSHKVQ